MKIRRRGGIDTYSITDFDIKNFPIPKVRERFPNGFDVINVHYDETCTPERVYISQSWGNMESILLESREDLAIVSSFLLDYMEIEETKKERRN